jgi:hypothetical protein
MPAEIPDGAVLVARAILNSSLWTMRADDRVVAMTCIALCNRRRRRWWNGEREITIETGQFVRSREGLAKACNLPLQRVRTSVQHLENTGFLTRKSTRSYTVYSLPKYQHYQDLAKYSDSAISEANPDSNPPLTRDQPAANHKQQHRQPSVHSESAAKPKSGGDGTGDVVVVGQGLLERISVPVSTELLESISVSKPIAAALAAQKTVGQILRAVQQARFQIKPGGWARMALESDWTLPESNGPERLEVMRKLSLFGEKRKAVFRGILEETGISKRLPGEDEDAWFKRVNNELKKRREESKPGRKASKGT